MLANHMRRSPCAIQLRWLYFDGVIHSVRFADDKANVAHSTKDLQLLIDRINYVTRVFGIYINVKPWLPPKRNDGQLR